MASCNLVNLFTEKRIISFLLCLLIICARVICQHVYIYIRCMSSTHKGQKRAFYIPEMVFKMIMTYHVVGRNQSHVLLSNFSSTLRKTFSNASLLGGNLLICIPYFQVLFGLSSGIFFLEVLMIEPRVSC